MCLRLSLVHAGLLVLAFSVPLLQADEQTVGPVTENVETAQYEQVLYVSAALHSNALPDGSRQSPFRGLEQSLESAHPASAGRRIVILVADGNYSVQSLRMKSHVDLYGGFDADDWSRDVHRQKTILTAQGDQTMIIGADDARIDGFFITGAESQVGGGAFLCDGSSPVITNNYIEANRTVRDPKTINAADLHGKGNGGAAICCIHASPMVKNNRIGRNTTDFGDGGAIYCMAASHPTIHGNLFYSNESGLVDPDTRSSNGGAIACTHYSNPVIRHNVFLSNHAGGRGDGGAIYGEYFCQPQLDGNIFLWNSSEDDGAAVYFMAAARPRLRGNLFVGNGPGGGAIRLSKNGLAQLEANTIVGNPSGGIICRAASLVSVNNFICENSGAGISAQSSVVSSQNDTICGQSGCGIATLEGGARIVNSMVVANQARQLRLDTTDIWVRYCLLVGQHENEPRGVSALVTTSDLGLDRVIAFDQPPRFHDVSWTSEVRLAGYDPDQQATGVRFMSMPPDVGRWVGRPVRIGGRWTVIRGVDPHGLSA